MKLTQNWVGYLDRSYEQIKASILKRLSTKTPEITDYSESNPLIIILSFFSGIGEMLNLYIDKSGKEAFISTCVKYTSIVRHAKNLSYQIKAKSPASVDLLFTLLDPSNNITTYTGNIIIPVGTLIVTSGNIKFYVEKTVIITSGNSQVFASAINRELTSNQILGVTNGQPNQQIRLSNDYVHKSLQIQIANDGFYYEFDATGLMDSEDKGFTVSIEEDGNAYLTFGDGSNGIIPAQGNNIIATYYTSDGLAGNVIAGQLNQLNSTINLPEGYNISVTNPNNAIGGDDFEDIEDIRINATKSIQALNRAVTENDFVALSRQVAGVGDAKVKKDFTAKFLYIYIAPKTKGIATTYLLEAVKQYLNQRKIIGRFIDTSAAGISRIWLKGTVYGKPLYTETQINLALAEALDNKYGYGNSAINNNIVISQIIALVEDLDCVDRFDLAEVRLEPFARTVDATTNLLNISFLAKAKTTTKVVYKLVYNTGSFEVYRDGSLLTSLATNTPYNDNDIINFEIGTGTYVNNDAWEFTVFPTYPDIFPATLIAVDDYTQPIIEVSDYVDDNTQRTIYGELTIK